MALLWRPGPPPPPEARPPLLDVVVQPMIALGTEALAQWVERGDPNRDDHYIRWWGQMVQAWRKSAAELLDLDTPEPDWPFETDPRQGPDFDGETTG